MRYKYSRGKIEDLLLGLLANESVIKNLDPNWYENLTRIRLKLVETKLEKKGPFVESKEWMACPECHATISKQENNHFKPEGGTFEKLMNEHGIKRPKAAKLPSMLTETESKRNKCHCGKNGHPFNSINCPVHGKKPIKKFIIINQALDPDYIYSPKPAQIVRKINEIIDYLNSK